jgi:DNA-binding NtrC family response regulator
MNTTKKTLRKSILLVEDDGLFRRSIKNFLEEKYEIWAAESAEDALDILIKSVPTLVLLDITLPGMDGISILKKVKTSWPDLPIIMLTANDRIPTVVESIKLGAFDYLTKPIMIEELLAVIDRAIESAEIKYEIEQRRRLQLITNKEYKLVGTSAALNAIRREIQLVGKSDSTVLIEGETGTGKELVARAIHACSPRASGPFVALNCAAIPRDLMEAEFFGHKKGAFTGAQADEMGKLQLANHGTLLLDEIGELPSDAQTKLLRVLEEQEFYPVGSTKLIKTDVRVIASTNVNLKDLVKQKSFREDLLFRLDVYRIVIPPLRERPKDIVDLACYFLKQFNLKFGKNFQKISPDAKELLLKHPWQGNVRELRNLIERATLYHEEEVLQKAHLGYIQSAPLVTLSEETFKLSEKGIDLNELEKKLLLQALELAKGNKTKAAKLLNLSPPTFYYRLEKYGLKYPFSIKS